MGLFENLTEDMKAAMKNKEKERLATIRQLVAQVKDAKIAKRGEDLTEEEVQAVLNNAGKKRKDSIEAYKNAGRDDLVAIEEAELKIIQDYLPKQLSEAEIAEVVATVITETGASGASDFGKVMKETMAKLRGRADGKMIQAAVRAKLQ